MKTVILNLIRVCEMYFNLFKYPAPPLLKILSGSISRHILISGAALTYSSIISLSSNHGVGMLILTSGMVIKKSVFTSVGGFPDRVDMCEDRALRGKVALISDVIYIFTGC